MRALPLQRPPRQVRQWLVPAAGRRAGSIGAGQMARYSPVRGRATGLTGRRSERDVLDRLIDGVRGGEGRALVVIGEPGVGKTALLDYLAGHAAGFRVARVMGVQSEMELASPACISCARRCWITSISCRFRNVMRCGPRSGSAPGRPRSASWSAWPR
jgi:hypothetical protein